MRSDERRFRAGFLWSGILHTGVALLFLLSWPREVPQVQEDAGVEMVFAAAGSAGEKPVLAEKPGKVAAAADQVETVDAPKASEKPRPAPIAPAPPPPPPPPPPTPQPSVAPPLPKPPPPLPLPPPAVAPSATPAPPPPPVKAPPTPPAPPVPTPPAPPPPVPVPVPKTVAAPNSQPNPTKNPAPESTELQNTLEKLRAIAKQAEPPKARYNPAAGGAPGGGGDPKGDSTSRLSAGDARAIGASVERCWTYDAGALGVDKLQVLLTVTTDAAGVARDAVVAAPDQGRLGDPVFRAFSERAVRAVRSPSCAALPLPPGMQGKPQVFTFRFRPGA